MILSKCATCGSKKPRFFKNQEGKGLLSSLDLRTPLSKGPILGHILFWIKYRRNETVNKFLLAGDDSIPEMHLRQPGFTYSACGTFTKNIERIQKLKETGYTKYIYKKELDKACVQHDMAYGDFKDLTRRTASDKILRDKAFNIVKNPTHYGYQRGACFYFSMFTNFFNKKSAGSGVNMHANNEKLA